MMSRGLSRTNTKITMELSARKDNKKLLTFVRESFTPDSTGFPDTPPAALKNKLKITKLLITKLNEMIKLHIHYLHTDKLGCQFPSRKDAGR